MHIIFVNLCKVVLSRYCDCFAAGIYCAEGCACVGCFNRAEYDDRVLETRKQIESRNPLAFAPKIVPPVNGSPINSGVLNLSTLILFKDLCIYDIDSSQAGFTVQEDGRSTPSSARHKRGCNCKKSMCLKKYCECYQVSYVDTTVFMISCSSLFWPLHLF